MSTSLVEKIRLNFESVTTTLAGVKKLEVGNATATALSRAASKFRNSISAMDGLIGKPSNFRINATINGKSGYFRVNRNDGTISKFITTA